MIQTTEKRINDYVELISDVLMLDKKTCIKFGFEYPKLYETNFPILGKQYMLQLPNTDVIEKDKVYYFFSIAHELRHQYQLEQLDYYERGEKEKLELYPEEIKKIKEDLDKVVYEIENKLVSAEQPGYNERFIELDANAFGYLAMYRLFGIEIDFKSGTNRNGEKKGNKEIKLITKALSEEMTVITDEDFLVTVHDKNYDTNETKDWLVTQQ